MSEFYSSNAIDSEPLRMASIVDAIGQLAVGLTRSSFQLKWAPIKPRSFAIPDLGVTDRGAGVLVGPDGECGSIDYSLGCGAIDTQLIIERDEWMVRYYYDTSRVA